MTIGLVSLINTANRRRLGTTSRKTSTRLLARYVATRPRQACDEPAAHRVASDRKHDRDDRRHSLRCDCCRCCASDDDTDLMSDQLVSERAQKLRVHPTVFDFDGTSLDPAEFMQPSHKRGNP